MTGVVERTAVQEDAEPTGLLGGKVPIQVALQELRLRLLDLTGRNRLINFKHAPGKTLQFIHSSIEATFRRLTSAQNSRVTIAPLSEPTGAEWTNRNGRLVKPEPRDHAVQSGLDPSYELKKSGAAESAGATTGAQARTLFFAEELGKHCRKLEREAKLAIEETGANMLYLVMGFLEFQDVPDSEKMFRAPLLCIPVSISKTDEGKYSTFHLTHTGEELADNLSLREKIKRDFGLNLPEYDAESETSVEAYLALVEEAIATLPTWRVSRMMTLTLLSFTNMLLVRDLDPENWPETDSGSSLLAHPLVRQVFEGSASAGGAQYATEYKIDEHPKGAIPLIYDADSSQHSALIDVLEGKNRVIEGPPGTGKSQTITNLIAAALQAGKKVLFVAEKLAALEVVKSRLTQAGLDPFVLELHSNKTNKKRVLDDLGARIRMRATNRADLPALIEQQEVKRRELKAYADLVNTKVGESLDLTLQQVMWRAERHRLSCGASASKVEALNFPAAARTSPGQLALLCDRLHYLSEQLEPIGSYGSSHPLWGFYPTEFTPEDDLPVHRTLEDFARRFQSFATAATDAAAFLGGASVNMSLKSANRLLDVMSNLAPADPDGVDFSLLPALFPPTDPEGQHAERTLNDIQAWTARIEALEVEMRTHLRVATPASEEVALAAKEVLLELRILGLRPCTQERLEALGKAVRPAVDSAKLALDTLKDTAQLLGWQFEATSQDATRLLALAKCVISAPLTSAHLRHEGLRTAGAATILRTAGIELAALRDQQAKLEAALYTDFLPSEDQLNQAIGTLREGDAWYRVFQRQWRGAVNLHRRIDRSKSKKSAAARLSELEALKRHSEFMKLWLESATLKAAAGVHFDGQKTPLDSLGQCAVWIEKSTMALEAAEVPTGVFDPLLVERSVLSRLAGKVQVVEAAVLDLSRLDSALRGSFADALPRILKEFDDPSLPARVDSAERLLGHIEAAVGLMRTYVRPTSTADDGLRVLMASQDLPLQVAALERDSAGKALLGTRFRGRATNLEPALAAHRYGVMVKRAELPVAMERVLVSKDCVDNHNKLTAYGAAISQGWKDVEAFNAAMAKYGSFDVAHWVDQRDMSTSDYASALAARTQRASDGTPGLLAWAQYVGARKEVVDLGLGGFAALLESGAVPPTKVKHAFIYRFYASVAQSAFERSPELRKFSGLRHSSVRTDFAGLDRDIIQLRGKQVAHECCAMSKPPAGNFGARVDDKTEMELIRHLLTLQRPRTPVRKMLMRAGLAIQELKPCFMMGPKAVAQFLAPGHLHFDIVVMDEASQLRPEEAIGAVARGTQLVVVGDPKQLPPTSFFARMAAIDGDEDGMGQMVTSEAESILDVCMSHFQPVRTLRWHYRSRHESLIAFSNHHFYRGKLVVFPSPYPKSKSLGLRYQYVADGVYESQMNQVEARRIVEAAVEHIHCRPADSLGIVTLNIKQRDLVAELLEERLRSLPQAIEFKQRWDAEGMCLFIKNLENVQGDERDCIMISTTFGKPSGVNVVRQNFGPISREGGWRRLNVLFTRARKSVAIFSSMRPEDIVVDGQTPEGTKALRHYLEYARSGTLPIEVETGLEPDSDFEVSVLDVLRLKGYDAVPQLGVAGFRIDIAVRHPVHRSGYLAAIECDGASYHTGVSVRDRDRIRQEILEGLGWKGRIWRIWSTDWFRNPLAETARLLQFLDGLKAQPLPEEYALVEAVEAEPTPIARAVPAQESLEQSAKDIVFDDEDDDLEVAMGDLVTYAPTASPAAATSVRITARQTNLEAGLVAENTPLGDVLMGATVGETVVLRVPGKPPQPFVIQAIKRATEEATQ